jgi:mono/diheme cytochrome c family protein
VRRFVWLVSLLAVLAVACRRKPSREWRADDHDDEPGTSTQVAGPTPSTAASAGDDALSEATWRSTCAICHGMRGLGDGPNGPMVKAPNLTDPQLLGARTDEQLAATIRAGRGKMPAFPQLPPAVVAALVRRIRAAAAPPQ